MLGFGRFDWGNWLYGLFSGFIGGGAGAVVSGVTVSMFDKDNFYIGSSKFFLLVGAVFLTNGTLTALAFLKQQPLPPHLKTVTTSVEQTVQPGAPTIVSTRVEETHVEPIVPKP